MKFYRDKFDFYYWGKVYYKNITAIYQSALGVILFFKNGLRHNDKNIAYNYDGYSRFFLNDECYGNQDNFTKESWRRFVKLQAFL